MIRWLDARWRWAVVRSKFQVPRSKFQVPSSKFQVPSSKFQVPSSKFQVPRIEIHDYVRITYRYSLVGSVGGSRLEDVDVTDGRTGADGRDFCLRDLFVTAFLFESIPY